MRVSVEKAVEAGCGYIVNAAPVPAESDSHGKNSSLVTIVGHSSSFVGFYTIHHHSHSNGPRYSVSSDDGGSKRKTALLIFFSPIF